MNKNKIIYIGEEIDQLLFERFILALRKHGTVKLGKFGTFRLQEMKSRKGVNINDGQPITIKAQKTVKFKPSDVVKRLIQEDQKS